MAKTLREVAVKILFNADPTPINDVKKAIGGLTGALGLSALSVGGIFAGLVKVVENTTQFADEIETTAKRLGLTTTELQQFQAALKQTGNVAAEDTVSGLTFFTRVLGDAEVGSKSARHSLALAGVDFAKFGDRMPTTSEAIFMVAERMKAIQNPAIRASIAADLFGKMGGPRLVGALSAGAGAIADLGQKAKATGAVLDEEAIAAAVKADKVFKQLKGTSAGLARAIGGELLKSLLPTIEALQEFLVANKGEIVKEITGLFRAMGVYVRIAGKFLKEILVSFRGFAQIFGGIENVVKALAVMAAIFVSGKILVGIASTASAIVGLINLFQKATVAATLMDAAASAIPIAIGAAFAAIGLIIEDIYQFFSGGDSVLGLLLGDNAKEVMDQTEAFFAKIFGFIEGIANLDITSVFSGIADALGSGSLSLFPGLGGFAAAGPASAPLPGGGLGATGGGGGQDVQDNRKLEANVSFTLGQGVPASQVAPEVQKGVEDAFQTILRTSSKNTAGGVAY